MALPEAVHWPRSLDPVGAGGIMCNLLSDLATCPSGLRERIANPCIAGSNPAVAYARSLASAAFSTIAVTEPRP